ncbi:GMP reductase 1-like, partial [Poecilia reticulata]|uniref:GMP reductase 1-like n=1 Tax=Poecilia reticulata TaxID=8081 RepID=UPI0004A3B3B2
VDLRRTFTFRNSKQTYTGIPIIAANMDTTGTFEMAKVLSKHTLFTAIHKHYSVEDWKSFAADHPECLEHVAASSGSGNADLEKLCAILQAVPALQYICLDVANGYSEYFVEFVKTVREKFPKHTIMAGNVVTGEMVEELILSGADIIKVGIGPGSVCTTRIKTGVGYPQLSAVIECADSAHGLKGHIISVRTCCLCLYDCERADGQLSCGNTRAFAV